MQDDESTNRKSDDTELARFRKELIDRLDKGRRQLDEGDYVEFDENELRRFFDGLIERAQRRAESK